jgi:hypothetical protein
MNDSKIKPACKAQVAAYRKAISMFGGSAFVWDMKRMRGKVHPNRRFEVGYYPSGGKSPNPTILGCGKTRNSALRNAAYKRAEQLKESIRGQVEKMTAELEKAYPLKYVAIDSFRL